MNKKITSVLVLLAFMLLVPLSTANEFGPVKYAGYDHSNHALNFQMWANLSTPTNLRIVENLYSYDSSGNPTNFYSTVVVVDTKVPAGNNLLKYKRPVNPGRYSYIETIVLRNNKVVMWHYKLHN